MNTRLSTEIRAALDDGRIVVLLQAAPAGIEAARAAAREVCAKLVLMAGSGPAHVSRSATPGHLAVAISRCGPVGVDIERLQPSIVDDALLALALHPAERSDVSATGPRGFFDLWVRKEAVLKMAGMGLSIPPSTVNVGPVGKTWAFVRTQNNGQGYVRNLEPGPDWAAGLAVVNPAPMYLLRDWQTDRRETRNTSALDCS